MFFNKILFSVLLFSTSAFAANDASQGKSKQPVNIIVNAKVRNVSAMAQGDEIKYSKTFDIVILNSSEMPVDLKEGCFKGVMPDKKELSVDTIERVLTRGMLPAGASLKGFIGFAAPDEDIYKVSAVKFRPAC